MLGDPQRRSWRSAVGLALSGALLVGVVGCTLYAPRSADYSGKELTATVTRDFAVGSAPALVVDDANGPVTVEAGDAGKIAVTAEKGARTQAGLDRIEVGLKQDGDTVTLEYKRPKDARDDESPRVKFTVRVPANTKLDLGTSNGSIDVKNVTNGVAAHSSNGIVTTTNVQGTQVLNSSNGGVTVTGATGTAQADVGNGGVDVQGKLTGQNLARTGNGGVTVKLSPSANLQVVTQAPTVTNEFGLSLDGGKRSQATIGTGADGTIEATAGNGSVHILKR